MPLILGTNSIKDTGFNVANSLRFNDGSADYLNRTPSSQGNLQISTFSYWVKRSSLGEQIILTTGDPDTAGSLFQIYFSGNDSLHIETASPSLVTNRKFRDLSAWYHIVVAVDTTQGTDSNRVKIYVNGVQETSFALEQYPTQNANLNFNKTVAHYIGVLLPPTYTAYYDGYMAEVVHVDGQQLTPTSFGEFDEDSPTIWKPIDVSGLTFGTNGFHLDFENASSLGADVSGNSNNFTVNNLTSVDQSTDTCSNNFATLNPIVPTSSATFSEGNLKIVGSSSSAYSNRSQSTFAVESGKWYFEVEVDSFSGSNPTIGIGYSSRAASLNPTLSNAGDICIRLDNEKYDEGSSSASYFSSSISNGNIIGVALDMDNGKIWFSLQGTFVGTVGSSGEAATFTVGNGINITPTLRPMDGTLICNFGSPPYTISSGNADANGHGNFEYSVPSGYFALCTKNLAEFG